MLIFWFPSTYKSHVYTILWSVKYVIELCLKDVDALILKYHVKKI